ncbi:hypothetical protein B0J11DRAFT_510218 [Dendryphion nanum]|uniref:Uncharacterized protein n=1 Tax=Dendryphion nanum TaxID=256645 RepID=A0A9P9DAL9_9PLEO|nr:hypothetical protein B0J11DRAFT_510218 [Dendryphion nanum]
MSESVAVQQPAVALTHMISNTIKSDGLKAAEEPNSSTAVEGHTPEIRPRGWQGLPNEIKLLILDFVLDKLDALYQNWIWVSLEALVEHLQPSDTTSMPNSPLLSQVRKLKVYCAICYSSHGHLNEHVWYWIKQLSDGEAALEKVRQPELHIIILSDYEQSDEHANTDELRRLLEDYAIRFTKRYERFELMIDCPCTWIKTLVQEIIRYDPQGQELALEEEICNDPQEQEPAQRDGIRQDHREQEPAQNPGPVRKSLWRNICCL